jgi:phenylacetaldehyde dehydrogenase
MTTTIEPPQLLPSVRNFLSTPKRLFIDGQWVDPASGRTFATCNPATGEPLCQIAHGGKADIDSAVRAARRAFSTGPWPTARPSQRERVIWRIAELIEEHSEEIAQLETLDNGKSILVARHADAAWSADIFRYYAGWATKLEGRTISPSMPFAQEPRAYHAYTLREPLGVCGLIIPWNLPLVMAALKLGPALAGGNTVVLKPAEQTPLTALLLGEILTEAGLPPGVVNIVTGFGDAGAALAEHSDVDKIAFTGSTAVGKKIVAASQGNLKKVSLELGGKSPNIVFDDADLQKAIPGCLNGWLFNQGQNCAAGTRLYVQDGIFQEFTTAMAEAARKLRIGPGLDPANDVGPLISQQQLDRVTGYLDAGFGAGAMALTGGHRWGQTGYYVEPTILIDVQPESPVMREEIFGPVVCALPFSSADEVIAAANDTDYGLAAGVWTMDVSLAHDTARRLQAGTVWVNQYNGFDIALPFGGYKQSGWGRELGAAALDLFTQSKTVNIAI